MSARGSFKRITPRGLLSFGPNFEGIELGPLNVLIGPNGSGKSNFLDIISVLAACPKDVAVPIRASGGIADWIYRESKFSSGEITSDVVLRLPDKTCTHALHISGTSVSTYLTEESLSTQFPSHSIKDWTADVFGIQALREDDPFADENPDYDAQAALEEVTLDWDQETSVISQLKSSFEYGRTREIAAFYESIFIFGHWQMGRSTSIRNPQSSDAKRKRLEPDFSNLAPILNQFQLKPKVKADIVSKLQNLYHGISGFEIETIGTTMRIFLTEGERAIPASRLSDGTLKYLCLLALLCDPEPPAVICIEEPESGFHPDIIPSIVDLLKDASRRSQIIVTTHSDVLVDCLSDQPEAVIICERTEEGTSMKRLNAEYLKVWLENYSLGDLWTRGTLGGNRW